MSSTRPHGIQQERVALPNLLVAALRIALEAKYLGVPIDKVWKDVVFWTLTEKPHSMLIITPFA